MKLKASALALSAAVVVLAGCAQNRVSEEELRCAGGAVSGAAVGGFLGNLFGQGTGNRVMTAAGAIAGGAAGASVACE